MAGHKAILAVAAVAAVLGAAVGLYVNGPGPLLRTEVGQRVLQSAINANAPAPPPGLAIAQRGEPIPVLRLPSLHGETVELPKATLGRPVLINVWATWCGPCIEEMPELNRFAAAQGPNGTQVVGIALDDAQAVAEFLKRVPVAYPILLEQAGPADAGVQLGNAKGVLPYSVLISSDGRLLKQRLGPFTPGEIDGWAQVR